MESKVVVRGKPFPKRQNLDYSKLKEFADDENFEFDGNGSKFSKRVENNVGKGEIARYEQFLLFPQFSKDLYRRHVSVPACFERVNQSIKNIKKTR